MKRNLGVPTLPRADETHASMFTNVLLFLLTALGSALCWWPVSVEPSLDLSAWIPIACAALCTGISTTLNRSKWLLFVIGSGLGTFGGLCLSYTFWWPSDPIAGPLVPYSIALNTAIALVASFIAALTARKVFVSNGMWRRAAWVVLLGCVAFGPVTLAITPLLVGHRVAYNDRMAAARFAALKNAVERTAAGRAPGHLCDGTELKNQYSGPPFSEEDWRRITGNYVKQDGYIFMVYCREKGGYTIDAGPARERGDGTRRFCTDESGKIGCRMEWDRSRHQCLPCGK